MDSLFAAAACLLAGMLLRRLGRLPADANRTLAGVVIQFCAPPVAFLAARGMPLTPELLLPASMAWIMFGGGLVFFGLAARSRLYQMGLTTSFSARNLFRVDYSRRQSDRYVDDQVSLQYSHAF